MQKGAVHKIMKHPVAFAIAFVAFFMLMYAFLAFVDALPNPIAAENTAPLNTAATTVSNPENPVRITAGSIDLSATVVNPSSTDVNDLDKALENGAVRYPTSAQLGVDGTVLIFGHSSYLPVVYHQYYKTFDGIQNLKKGEIVSVYSGTTEYRYAVTGVRVANAANDVIELPQSGKHLTLVTCNSFATKSDRFIVTADFVGAYSLSSI